MLLESKQFETKRTIGSIFPVWLYPLTGFLELRTNKDESIATGKASIFPYDSSISCYSLDCNLRLLFSQSEDLNDNGKIVLDINNMPKEVNFVFISIENFSCTIEGKGKIASDFSIKFGSKEDPTEFTFSAIPVGSYSVTIN